MAALKPRSTVEHVALPGSRDSLGPWMCRDSGPVAPPKTRLLDGVRQAPCPRRLMRQGEEVCVAWIRCFILSKGKHHPAHIGAAEVTTFVTSLGVEGLLAASTRSQVLAAPLFFCRDVLEKDLAWLDGFVGTNLAARLSAVLTCAAVRTLLQRQDRMPRVIACLLCGAGLRVVECFRLRAQELHFASNQIVVRACKGDESRRTMIPGIVEAGLSQLLDDVRPQSRGDLAGGFAGSTHLDRLTGQRSCHQLSESVLQRAMRMALREGGIAKRASPQTLRHSFAMEGLEYGNNIRSVPQLLGHRETSSPTSSHGLDLGPAVVRSAVSRILSPRSLGRLCQVYASRRCTCSQPTSSLRHRHGRKWPYRPVQEPPAAVAWRRDTPQDLAAVVVLQTPACPGAELLLGPWAMTLSNANDHGGEIEQQAGTRHEPFASQPKRPPRDGSVTGLCTAHVGRRFRRLSKMPSQTDRTKQEEGR
jgi:site-specific recombinase XerD